MLRTLLTAIALVDSLVPSALAEEQNAPLSAMQGSWSMNSDCEGKKDHITITPFTVETFDQTCEVHGVEPRDNSVSVVNSCTPIDEKREAIGPAVGNYTVLAKIDANKISMYSYNKSTKPEAAPQTLYRCLKGFEHTTDKTIIDPYETMRASVLVLGGKPVAMHKPCAATSSICDGRPEMYECHGEGKRRFCTARLQSPNGEILDYHVNVATGLVDRLTPVHKAPRSKGR